MSADLFAGDPHMEGNDMAGPAGAGPTRWPPAGPDGPFQGQPMHQQVGNIFTGSHLHCLAVSELFVSGGSLQPLAAIMYCACHVHCMKSSRGSVVCVTFSGQQMHHVDMQCPATCTSTGLCSMHSHSFLHHSAIHSDAELTSWWPEVHFCIPDFAVSSVYVLLCCC